MSTADFLKGELERHFELETMMTLSEDLLGLDPADVGGTGGKGAFARALVERCAAEHALEALADAISLSAPGVNGQRLEGALDADAELTPDTEVGNFRVLKRLGKSSLSTTYLAERNAPQNGHTQRAALKVFDPALARDRGAVWRFLTRMRALRNVRATGLAQIFDAGVLPDGRPWVASEYITGQSLASRLGRTGAVHFNEIRPVARAVLRGLQELHGRGLVHGNLKAENIFLVRPMGEDEEQPGEAYGVLVDAGQTQLLERPLPEGAPVVHVVGEAHTVAPERLTGAPESAASEVYAAGALLYQAVAGRPPFEGDTSFEVLTAQLMEMPEPPSTYAPEGLVPGELDEVLLKALGKDPEERYASAGELADALEAVGRSLFPPPADEPLDMATLMRAIAALQESPGDDALASNLEALVEVSREWQQAVDAFMEAADASDDVDVKKALLFRSARILDQEMRDPEAAEKVYRVVLELDPEDAHAHNSLEELRRARGDYEGLVELLLDRLESESDQDARAAILREVAGLYEHELASPGNAQVAWTQVLLEDPDDSRAERAIERLTQTPEQWQEVLAALHEGLTAVEDRPRAQLQLYVLLGKWWDMHLERADAAVPYLSHALRMDPAHEPALEALCAVYRRSGSFGELAQLLVHRADAASSPASARELRADAARVYLEQLDDVATARGLLEEIVKEDPAHPQATAALSELLEREEDWEGVATLWENKVGELRGDARCEALCALAELHEQRLDDRAEAERRYKAALSTNERYLPALKGLERLHASSGDHVALLSVIDQQLQLGPTPHQRVGLLLRAAAIQEEALEEHAAAAERLEQVIEIVPSHSEANAALARLYRKLQRFDELAQTLDRQAKSVEDPEHKAQLLMQAARVLMADLGSPDRAAFMCERVLGLAPEHKEALELMARIRALGGDTLAAVDTIEVMADTESDPQQKAELWVRAGRYLEEAEDLDGAIERYRQALDADAENEAATEALRRLFERRGDAQGEAELLLRQIERCEDPVQRARKLVELGQLREQRLRDVNRAAEAYQKAAQADPENVQAALGLGLIALSREQWDVAAQQLAPLMDHSTELGAERALSLCLGVADAQIALGDAEAAENALLNAKALAPDDREVLERLAVVSSALGKHEEAAEMLSHLLDRQGDTLTESEQSELLLTLGEAQHAGGASQQALETLNRAVELSPESDEALQTLGSVQREIEDWHGLADTLERRLDLADDEDARFDLWVEIGDLHTQRLADRHRASEAYVAALELRAGDRNLLAKLMAAYSEDKDWSKLVEVLDQMASVVDEPAVSAKYLTTAASLAQRELSDLERAAQLYQRALDSDPSQTAAFNGLADCLTRSANWAALAQAYRAHIERVEDSAPAEQLAPLWDNLAQLLHYRLDRTEEAVQAYQKAYELDPDDRQRLERLAEIYGRHPGRYADEAVQTHAALLRQNPYRMESYQALRRLYTQVQRPDEAWCVCQALRALNVAEPDEATFFKRYRVQAAATAQECATEEIWREHIVHPDQDPLLTAIFASLTPATVASTVQPLSSFGTEEQYQMDPEHAEQMMPRMLHYAAGMTLLPLPAIYYRPEDPGGLSFIYSSPPAIGVGRGALADTPDQALAFIAGRHLSYFRAGHYMRQLVPTGSGLRGWLLAAIRLANPRFPVPDALRGQVEQNHGWITQTLTSPQQESLRSLTERLLRNAPELDMKRWAASVDLTADRVGFILANSLDAAIAVVRASPAESSNAPERDRLRELYLYSVSPEYLELRKAMGIQIG